MTIQSNPASAYGAQMAKYFTMNQPPTVAIDSAVSVVRPQMAITRLIARSGIPERTASIPSEKAYVKIAGTVRLHVVIGTDGSVQEVAAISGDPMLADAAVEAVRQWKYQVTTLNKEPVEVDTTVDVIFSLAP